MKIGSVQTRSSRIVTVVVPSVSGPKYELRRKRNDGRRGGRSSKTDTLLREGETQGRVSVEGSPLAVRKWKLTVKV